MKPVPCSRSPISVVIPTYRRDHVLVETIEHLLATIPCPSEIVVIDQDPSHDPAVESRLFELEEEGRVRRLQLESPSIPHAMNVGLLEACQELVLFVDDDIVPEQDLIGQHHFAYQREAPTLVSGRVIQPWHSADSQAVARKEARSSSPQWVRDFMGGNFSVRRRRAIELGGFDENFVGAGYRFEAEFASRLLAAGGKILFAPSAVIHHLRTGAGGTREYGDHQHTIRPHHAVGEYYYLLRGVSIEGRLRRLFRRPFKAVLTRFHLRHPWWVPVTLASEVAGFAWAIVLALRGPRYMERAATDIQVRG